MSVFYTRGFWSILTGFVDYYSPFWGPKAISMVVEPKMCLRVGRQDSQFRPIMARFLYYYSVLGSQSDFHDLRTTWCVYVSVINTHNFADSGPFCAPLLTALGSHSDFPGCCTPRCASVLDLNNPSFVRFRPVSWTHTHRFGVPMRFPWFLTPRCAYVSVINTRSFG